MNGRCLFIIIHIFFASLSLLTFLFLTAPLYNALDPPPPPLGIGKSGV